MILLDIVMPGMPCREVVQRLRTLRPDSTILLASGYTSGANVEALTEQTRLSLLRKPYDPDQMLRAVRDALDGTGPDSPRS